MVDGSCISSLPQPLKGHLPPAQDPAGNPPGVGQRPEAQGRGEGADLPCAAKVDRCRRNFLEPQWAQAALALLEASSNSKPLPQPRQVYSYMGTVLFQQAWRVIGRCHSRQYSSVASFYKQSRHAK